MPLAVELHVGSASDACRVFVKCALTQSPDDYQCKERQAVCPTQLCAKSDFRVCSWQSSCNRCNERLGNASASCVHCEVDCPMAWLKRYKVFEVVKSMGTPDVALATPLESVLSADLITEIITSI